MDPQQRNYLDAMGIQLWERRDLPTPADNEEGPAESVEAEPQAVETPVVESKSAVLPSESRPASKPEPAAKPLAVESTAPAADDGVPAWLDEAPPLDEPGFDLEEGEIDEADFICETTVPALPDINTLDWPALEQRVSECVLCRELVDSRSQPIFGVGNPQADLMIIGEAPDPDEDQQGEPFVGKTGPLFNAMLHAMGFKRQQLYITNVSKCCTPGDRDPKVDELASCEAFIQRQIALVQPRAILLVGRIAAHQLLKVDTPLGKLRGTTHHYAGNIPVVVTYHPGYLLRSPLKKRESWDDLCLARSLLD